MKKAPILITIVILAALGAAVYFVSDREEKKDINPWTLVSSSAIAVMETSNPISLQKLKIDSLGLIAFLSADSTIGSGSTALFVFQSVGNKVGFSALVQSKKKGSLLERLAKDGKASAKERIYEGTRITDLRRGDKPWLSLAEVGGVWLISGHSILVEEGIRNHRSEKMKPFRNAHQALFQFSNVKQDDGNLYINWGLLSRSLKTGLFNEYEFLDTRRLTHGMMFDLRWNQETLLLNGFAADTSASSTILSLFKEQKPVVNNLKAIVPEQFGFLIHFGISDRAKWLQRRTEFCKKFNPSITDRITALKNKSFQVEEFYKGIDDEIALCVVEPDEVVVMMELKEITKSVGQLNKLQTQLRNEGSYESTNYGNQVVHQLKIANLVEDVFWPIGFKSQEVFYTILNDVLVFGSSEKGIHRVIDQLEGENTLEKSLPWRKFSESSLAEANVSFFVNAENLQTADGTVPFLARIASLRRFSLQFYALEGNHYASAALQLDKTNAGAVKPVRKGFDVGMPIAGRPWLVKNHNDGTTEILVQDSTNRLHLLSKTGKILWTTAISGRIADQVEQVDFLKNGKLQYVFATPGYLHIVDRLGRYLDGYPKSVALEHPAYISVVDYNNTKNYRILLSEETGRIIITELDGKALDGWSPKVIDSRISTAPHYLRIKQKDYYATLSANGDLNLFNRRGEAVPGYPQKLHLNASGDLFSDGKSIFVAASEGKLLQLSTAGKIVHEEFLLKNVTQALFRLVSTSNQSAMIVTRSERGNFSVFNQEGTLLFDMVNPVSENMSVEYFHFGKGKDVVVVFDKEQHLFYAVDLSGKKLIPQPIQSTQPPTVIYENGSRALNFVVANGSSLELISASF